MPLTVTRYCLSCRDGCRAVRETDLGHIGQGHGLAAWGLECNALHLVQGTVTVPGILHLNVNIIAIDVKGSGVTPLNMLFRVPPICAGDRPAALALMGSP